MAFTPNPTVQTIVTKRFDFTGGLEQRDGSGTKDQKYTNFFLERTSGVERNSTTWWLKSRPGISNVYTLPAGEARGMYYWNAGTPAHMSIIGNGIYYNGTFLSTIGTSTGPVGFTEYLDDTGARKLILLDGTNGYVFTAYNVAPTQITDVDFPTPHAPTPIFLDGYLFVAKPGTQDIYNSNLNDPLTWTAGDYISAEMYPDSIVGLSRNNNYIYAIGQYSIEFLYDAANATGSPLNRHDSAVQQFGTPALESVVAAGKATVMIGQLQEGGRTVYSIEGFKEVDIGTPAVQEALNLEGTNINNAVAYAMKLGGQEVYVLCLTSRTLVYGFENKVWFDWTFVNTPKHSSDSATGYPYVLVPKDGVNYIGSFNPNTFTDLGQTITCTIITSKFDFDTLDRKRMDLLTVVGDAPATGNVPLSVQWSDDDYITWSTARTLNMNSYFSRIYRLGMFRRRAFKFTYTAPYLLRLEGLEITVNKGQT